MQMEKNLPQPLIVKGGEEETPLPHLETALV